MTSRLSVARTLDRCRVLGPGTRAVIWVQGCPLRCAGCVAAETLPFDGGTSRTVAELADWLTRLTDVDGVTFSGGEPFRQAGGLAELLDLVRERRGDFGAVAYSGFRHEALRRAGPEAAALLDRVDLLIDGPYLRARHGDLRWRGSTNQRLIPLTDRYRWVLAEPDATAGMEMSVDAEGVLSWAGVPPTPGFRRALEERLARRGFELHVESGSDR